MEDQTALLAPVAPPVPDDVVEDLPITHLWKFEVVGEPVPQGSWVAFVSKSTGHAMAKPSNEKALKAWRKLVADTALLHRPPWLPKPYDGPVYVSLIFVRKRNDSDYLADGVTLRKGAPRYPDTAPDVDKLTRAMLDSLAGVAYTNDARVVTCPAIKRFAALDEEERVLIDVGFL
jgi:Holliday junction resolvase RusA-like endonuclease